MFRRARNEAGAAVVSQFGVLEGWSGVDAIAYTPAHVCACERSGGIFVDNTSASPCVQASRVALLVRVIIDAVSTLGCIGLCYG